MDNKRSPNYPAVGLGDALELARALWAKEKRAAMNSDVAAKAWGYGGVNGLVRVKLSALKKFGLLEGRGENGVRLTDVAVHLIQYPPGSAEHQQALQDVALRPELFREVHETHADASDDNLKAYLVTKKGFGDSGAQQFIKAFRDTLSVAKLEQPAYNESVSSTQIIETPTSHVSAQVPVQAPLAADHEPVRIALEGGGIGRVIFSGGEPTPEDIEALIDVLKIQQRQLIKKWANTPDGSS